MKERPILMKGAMVRATLEDRKTHTRRIVKPQPLEWAADSSGSWPIRWDGNPQHQPTRIKCPYGVPGDRLWVKETFTLAEWYGDHYEPAGNPERRQTLKVLYRATEDETLDDIREMTWKPSIFMPRWASRITLEIESVRVERIIEITAEDCIAEGIYQQGGQWIIDGSVTGLGWMQPEGAYREL